MSAKLDAKRSDAWGYDPEKICIIGGKILNDKKISGVTGDLKGMPETEEAGDIDTAKDENHPLFDKRLEIGEPLSEQEVANTDAFGVILPVVLVKIDGVMCVEDGRRRVRRARIVNRWRKKAGQAPITVPCVVHRPATEGADKAMIGAMISANAIRSDDSQAVKLSNLLRYKARGVSDEDCALAFGEPLSAIKSWIAFHDNAAPALKKAVESNKINITHGVVLARLPAEEQPAKLAELLDSGNGQGTGHGRSKTASVRAAREIVKKAKGGKGKKGGTPSKVDAKRMLAWLRAKDHPSNVTPKTLSYHEGLEDAFAFMLGDGDNEKLSAMLEKAREAKAVES